MITPYDKAIAAFISSGLSLAAAFGLPIGSGAQTVMLAVTPLISMAATYWVPNKHVAS